MSGKGSSRGDLTAGDTGTQVVTGAAPRRSH